jgi:hypothetical protein
VLIKIKSLWIPFILSILGLFLLLAVNHNIRVIFAPIFISIILVSWLLIVIKTRELRFPMFDIGIFCCLLVSIYTSYPLLNYYFGGFSFGILGDNRLTNYSPTPYEIGIFHIRHVIYLFSLVFFYLIFRKSIISLPSVLKPNAREVRFIFGGYIFCLLFFLIMKLTLGLSYDSGYDTESTHSQMAINSNIPLPILQFAGKLAGLQFIFKIGVVAISILKSKTSQKWRMFFLIWMFFEIIYSIVGKGSRDSLMFFLISTILLYSHLYKSVSFRFLAISGILVFLFFMFMGFYRTLDNITSWSNVFESLDVVLSANNEFQVLLGTSYDVFQRKESGANIPWHLYINDIVPLLPPSQFLPFEKLDASEWYLRELGISGTGQGFMWGVISQSIIGLDWIELLIRGSFLGFLLAKIHNYFFVAKGNKFIMLIFYLVLCLNVYNTYRNTTGSILYPILWEIIPFYILMKLFTGQRSYQV